MGSAAVSSVLLLILNVIQTAFGLALSAVAIWFFIEVHAIASLRNTNYYLVNHNIYWPQAIPWVFLLVGVLVLCASCCGFIGAKKKSTGFVTTYLVFEVFTILMALVAAAIALTFVDSDSTDNFFKETLLEIFSNMDSDVRLKEPFGNLEKRLQCCGASSPRDYGNIRSTIPIWCCNLGLNGAYQTHCELTNDLVNRRYGCSTVVVSYARIMIRTLAGASVVIAFFGVISTFIAIAMNRRLRRKPRALQVQKAIESKKVLS